MQTRFGTMTSRLTRRKIIFLSRRRSAAKTREFFLRVQKSAAGLPKEFAAILSRAKRAVDFRALIAGFCLGALMCCGAVLLAGISRRNAANSLRLVTVSVDGYQAVFATHRQTVADLLSFHGIETGENDSLNLSPEKTLENGDHIFLRRAMTVYVKDNNEENRLFPVRVSGGTVGDAIANSVYSAAAASAVHPGISTPLKAGMVIEIDNVTKEIIIETEEIPYKEIRENDATLLRGNEIIAAEGMPGERQITTQITYVNGEESARTVISSALVREAADRVVKVGTKNPATPKPTATPKKTNTATPKPSSTSPKKTNQLGTVDTAKSTITVGGKTYKISETLSMEVTAYTHTGNKTATGKWPEVGMVAVNTSLIPYGTKMYIPGYGFAIAEDTGVRGTYRIDLFMNTYDECIKWGRKRDYTVYILE